MSDSNSLFRHDLRTPFTDKDHQTSEVLPREANYHFFVSSWMPRKLMTVPGPSVLWGGHLDTEALAELQAC